MTALSCSQVENGAFPRQSMTEYELFNLRAIIFAGCKQLSWYTNKLWPNNSPFLHITLAPGNFVEIIWTIWPVFYYLNLSYFVNFTFESLRFACIMWTVVISELLHSKSIFSSKSELLIFPCMFLGKDNLDNIFNKTYKKYTNSLLKSVLINFWEIMTAIEVIDHILIKKLFLTGIETLSYRTFQTKPGKSFITFQELNAGRP